jgi:xanthine dehydrogenase accessory factor
MNETSFWNFILKTISSEKKIVLLVVSESSNSSPGRQGFKMAVTEDAEMIGTIGGGIMEKDMIEYSLGLLFGKETRLIKKLYHSDKTNFEKSGLICGGFQTIIFSVLDKSHFQTIENILSSISQKQNGKLSVMPGKIEYQQTENIQPNTFHYNSDEDWKYAENLGLPLIAYIAGGGHVGLAVSRVMKLLGFHVIVFDHREDVYTIEQNKFADEIIICKYEEIENRIIESDRSYIIIVTPMHAGDKDSLKSVINKNVKYIGMMGSQRKIKSIFDALTGEGVDKELLKKVHTPIGLEIEAETPEEIAISIAAEIIKVKNS